MKITLTDAGKRFNRDWIFRHLSYTFIAGRGYAITGPNGSGKSTLLQSISGSIGLSEGRIHYYAKEEAVPTDQAYQHLSLAAPYMELIEEMTATEFLSFHQVFKPFLPGLSINEILEQVQLKNSAHKQIRYYSSGMKQRLKLAQAIFTNCPFLLLDEPCTNLDAEGIQMYQQIINRFSKDRLVIVSSNDQAEYLFCEEKIEIRDFKK
ncbi:MAG: ABC transporter ATP-binding protein [Bacteroidetes bacterium]|nr:MAG: ABC transporter ATP-binding protein [Bacteroidota bacterium]